MGMILLVMIVTTPRLRVYYRINAIKVQATQTLPDNSSIPVTLPKQFHRSGRAGGTMSDQLDRTERRIQKYCDAHPEARAYKWTIHYSHNSSQLHLERNVRIEP